MSSEAINEILQAYLSTWTERDAAIRRQLLEKSWTDDGTYTDPTIHVPGREALLEVLAGFVQQFPDYQFVLTSEIEEHHHLLRFFWRLVRPDGSTGLEGMDFAELAEDGRLKRIVGFF